MKKQSTGRGFAYLSMAELLVKIMSVVYVPFLVAILGEEGHGIYAVSYEAFALIYVLTNEGIQRGVAKLVAELHAKDNPRDALKAFRLARTLLIFGGLIASLLLFFMAPYIARAQKTAEATLSIQALAPTVLITAVLSAYRGYFLGRSFITANAVSKVVEQIVNVAVSLVAAFFLMKVGLVFGVTGGTFGTSVGALVAVALLVHEFRKGKLYKVRKKDQDPETYHYSSKELIQRLLSYSFPITLTAGVMHLGGIIDTFIFKNRLITIGFTEVMANIGYSTLVRYKSLLLVPNTIIVSLAAVILPGISRANALQDKKDMQEKISYAVKMVFTVALPSFVGLSILAEPIYHLLYPGKSGYEMFWLGSITVVFLGFIQIQNSLYQGVGKFYWGTFSMVAGILVRILLNYIFVGIPEVNILGGVVSHMANFIVPFIINHILITRVLKYPMPLLKNAWKPFLASLGMGIVLFVLNLGLSFIEVRYIFSAALTGIIVVVGILVYGVLILLLGGISKKDLTDISPRLYRMLPSSVRSRMRA